MRTPAFDRVAREGALFTNAHAAAPSCSPSRAAILTGQDIWRLEHGSALLGFLPAKYSVYPDILEAAGYCVGFSQKGYAPAISRGRPRNPAGPEFRTFAAFLAKRPKNAPFCFWLGSRSPHRPYERGAGAAAGKTPAQAVPPLTLPDSDMLRLDMLDYFADIEVFDAQVAEVLAALEEAGELDNTMIVVTGDNGWAFPRAKATCYEAGTHEPLAIRWGMAVKPGRVVEDFVSLADLCPTFLEAVGAEVPVEVNARSLLSILRSDRSGQVDPTRDHVIAAMETHVPSRDLGDGRSGGYPIRSLLTRDFHYIRNFAPERWPAGDPAPDMATLDFDGLATKTQAAFADVDASPAKADLVMRRADPAVRPLYELSFAHRPARELYDRRADPAEMRNLANDPAYAEIATALERRLMAALAAAGDPRAHGGGAEFDTYTVTPPAWKGGRKVK